MRAEPLMTTADVAQRLGYTMNYVRRLLRLGKLPGGLKPGGRGRAEWRIKKRAFDEWVEKR